jgi:hypothetical protein
MTYLSFEVGEEGCLIAKDGEGVIGTGGLKNAGHLIELAIRTGFPSVPSDKLAVHAFFDDKEEFLDASGYEHNVQDWIDNVSDTALTWMNNNVAPEGSIFYWNEGSFYLSLIEDMP